MFPSRIVYIEMSFGFTPNIGFVSRIFFAAEFHDVHSPGVRSEGTSSALILLKSQLLSKLLMIVSRAHSFSLLIFFTSSSEVYGDCQCASEIAPVNIKITPRSSYAVEKLMFETFLRTRPGSVILRLFNIIGPGQDPSKGVVAKFYKAIKEGSPVTVAKGCSRSFCDVRDAIGEILAISEPGTYNIGSNLITLEIEDLFQRMAKFFGQEPPVTRFVPGPYEIFDRSPNLSKILKLYKPVYKLEDTLKSFKHIL